MFYSNIQETTSTRWKTLTYNKTTPKSSFFDKNQEKFVFVSLSCSRSNCYFGFWYTRYFFSILIIAALGNKEQSNLLWDCSETKIMSKKRCKRKEVYLRVYSWARDALSFNVWCWKQSNKKKKRTFFFLSKCICKGVNWGCIFWIIRKKSQRQMKWGKNRQGQSKKLGGNTIQFKSSFLCSTRNLFSIISIFRRRRKKSNILLRML